eukprot:895789-Rhodomonas_salina.1
MVSCWPRPGMPVLPVSAMYYGIPDSDGDVPSTRTHRSQADTHLSLSLSLFPSLPPSLSPTLTAQ